MPGGLSSDEKPELPLILGIALVLGILAALALFVYLMWQAMPDTDQLQTQLRKERQQQSQQCAGHLKFWRIALRIERID